jgi:hypothetical protein
MGFALSEIVMVYIRNFSSSQVIGDNMKILTIDICFQLISIDCVGVVETWSLLYVVSNASFPSEGL